MNKEQKREQAFRALQKAKSRRAQRSQLRAHIEAGEFTAADILTNVPDVLKDITLGDFLTWLPGIERKRAVKIIRKARVQVSVWYPLGQLTERNVAALVPAIAHYQPTKYPEVA